MITKLNPAAVNDKWGGVLCLELGSQKPDNFEEIIKAFDKIIKDKKHYVISVFDIEDNRYLGDAEMVYVDTNDFYVQQTRLNASGTTTSYTYHFNRQGVYERSFYVQNYNTLQPQINELKTKLNEITQTE